MIADRLATLGHPKRLGLFRLLMRRYPDHVAATELANALDLKPNTLSTYVRALMDAGLVSQERIGTSLRYAIDIEAARETFDYLLNDCCRGRPDICAPITGPSNRTTGHKWAVLFVCTGNSARSIMAEAILRREGMEEFIAHSAGRHPKSEVAAAANKVLTQHGHPAGVHAPKPVSLFQGPTAPHLDLVITLCDRAANEDCPAWPGHPLTSHWGLPDPSRVADAQSDGFETTYQTLLKYIQKLTTLNFDTMDPVALQRAIDAIPSQTESETS